MNARTLLLLVAALVLGGGLAYLFLGGDAPQRSTEGPLVSDVDRGPKRVVKDTEPTERTLPSARAELTGLSGNWLILPGGPKGEKLPQCRITTKRGNDTRTAKGQASFSGLDPGDWDLTIEADGLPTWRGTVAVAGGGKPTTTTPRLSNDIRVSGTLVDQRGEPVGGASVWLLPEGAEHPTDGNTAKELSLTPVTSTADGRFRIEAKSAGTWRLSVGKIGTEPRFVSDRFELELGRERLVRVTVPAHARLTVTCPPDEFTGANVLAVLGQREPSVGPDPNTSASDGDTVTDLTGGDRRLSPGELEAVRKKRELVENFGKGDVPAGAEGASLEDQALSAQKALEQMSEENQARMREAEERATRERNRRARLIEEGWATIRSVRFEPGAIGEVTDLPEGKNLRFVLYRGSEGFTISESLMAPVGASVELTVMPPPPFPPNVELPEVPRTAGSRMVVTPIGRDALPVGLVFES